MAIAWMVARVELRRRWAGLCVTGLLVALVTAVVIAGLVGAQRTSSAVDRVRDETRASHVSYQSDTIERAESMLAAVRAVESVETATMRYLVNAFLVDGPVPDIALMTDPDGMYGTAIDRPLVLEGRMPASDAPHEVLLNEMAARVSGFGTGDRIQAVSWSADDLYDLFSTPNFPGFNGPPLDLEVVGIGRMPEELPGDIRRTAPFAIGSPAFLEAHPGIGAWPPAVVVRTEPGAGLDEVNAATAAVRDPTSPEDSPGALFRDDTTAAEVWADTARATANSLALGLLVFAGAALLAGALAIAQAVQRQLAGSAVSSAALAQLGLTRAAIARAQTAAILVAGVAGALLGVAVAVALSRLFPLGLARRAEVDPGTWVAPWTVSVTTVALLALLTIGAFALARRAVGGTRPPDRRRSSALSRFALRSGATPTVLTGIRLAGDRGRSGGTVPVRTALAGVALAVAGLVGAGVIAASFGELEDTPSKWGWAWSTMPDYFGDGEISELEARLLEDDRVAAVARWTVDTVAFGDEAITTYALEPLRGSMSLTAIDGRLPNAPAEIALGRGTLDDLGLTIGDTFEAMRPGGVAAVPLTVVGTVVLPPTDEYALDVGAVLTPDGLAAAGTGDALGSVVLGYPDGADVATLEAALNADYGLEFNLFTRANVPGPIRNLAEPRNLAVALAVFFSALAVIGLIHALVLSTRRRRVDLAVLRAMGLRRAQVRGAITIEALCLAVGGAFVGMPLGLVTGRLVWRLLVDGVGAVAEPQTPWTVLLAVLPVVALAAVAASWSPGRTAARGRPGLQLRSE